jgi:hypothetical protein
MKAETSIDRCLAGLNRTKCCPPFMRRFLTSHLIGRPSEYLDRFLNQRIALVRNEIEPIFATEPELARLCEDLAGASGPQPVAARFGLEITDDYGFFTWEEWADHALAGGAYGLALYALANAWLGLDYRHDLPGLADYRAAWARWARQDYDGPMPYIDSPEMTRAEAVLLSRIDQTVAALRPACPEHHRAGVVPDLVV